VMAAIAVTVAVQYCLSALHLLMLSRGRIVSRGKIRQFVNKELDTLWKEAIVTQLEALLQDPQETK
jgi:hypothetical protein